VPVAIQDPSIAFHAPPYNRQDAESAKYLLQIAKKALGGLVQALGELGALAVR
jgi:hypothetical protein